MALALKNASKVKPQIRLAQAISAFEAELTYEQKSTLSLYQSQASRSPPNIADVTSLTAEIDRNENGRISRRRCFGTRFVNVLHAVQQFAALGDIVVGGSQNILACGVWALVRTTLLVRLEYTRASRYIVTH